MIQKRNRCIRPLDDLVKKRNAKSKRTKNMIKKAYELAILCNMNVNVSLFDPSVNKQLEFATNSSFVLGHQGGKPERADQSQTVSKNKKIFKYKLLTVDDFLDSNGNFDCGIMNNRDDFDECHSRIDSKILADSFKFENQSLDLTVNNDVTSPIPNFYIPVNTN